MSDDTNPGIQGQRVRPNKGHESISRDAIQDPRLSFKATGILTFLLSLPDKWRTDAERLSKAKNSGGKAREGRDAIQAGLRELEDAGYLVRRKYQDERGTWRWIWRYSDDPSDLRDLDVSPGQTGNGLPGDGPADDGPAGSLEVLQGEIQQKKDLKDSCSAGAEREPDGLFGAPFVAGVEPPANGKPRRRAGSSTPDPDGALFDEFWAAYPRKIGKGQARKAWGAAVKKTGPASVIAAARRFAESRRGEDPTFTPHPSTWLNGERWNDEPEQARNGGAAGGDRRSGAHRPYRDPEDLTAYLGSI